MVVTMGFSGTRIGVSGIMVVILFIGAFCIPMATPVEHVDASPLVQVSVEISPGSKDAIVTHAKGAVVTFEGSVTIEPVQGLQATTTLTATTSSGWEANVVPEEIVNSNPSTQTIHVDVAVPKGMANDHSETVTVRASSQVLILSPTVATDTAVITVKNTSPEPEWVVHILEPANNEVYTTDNLVVSGTASFNLGNITSVEVKVCTGTWQEATGTSEWSIDYDCKYLDDGEHTIYVKARAGEGQVSPTETIVAIQDRSSSNNGGPGTPSSDPEEGTTLWENQTVRTAIILAVLVGLGFVVTLWYRNRRPSQEMTLY
jgi:hypothetical protein